MPPMSTTSMTSVGTGPAVGSVVVYVVCPAGPRERERERGGGRFLLSAILHSAPTALDIRHKV